MSLDFEFRLCEFNLNGRVRVRDNSQDSFRKPAVLHAPLLAFLSPAGHPANPEPSPAWLPFWFFVRHPQGPPCLPGISGALGEAGRGR